MRRRAMLSATLLLGVGGLVLACGAPGATGSSASRRTGGPSAPAVDAAAADAHAAHGAALGTDRRHRHGHAGRPGERRHPGGLQGPRRRGSHLGARRPTGARPRRRPVGRGRGPARTGPRDAVRRHRAARTDGPAGVARGAPVPALAVALSRRLRTALRRRRPRWARDRRLLRVGPLGARLEASISHLQPEAVQGLGQGGDPLVVLVLFRCPDGRYCSGQFTATASETDQQVRVSDVTSREFRGVGCAGLRTVNGRATTNLELTKPPADREVVRVSDSTRLIGRLVRRLCPVASATVRIRPLTCGNVELKIIR